MPYRCQARSKMIITNTKTECPSKETLEQLLDGTLSDVAKIESHVESCNVCQIHLDQLSHSDLLKPFRKNETYHLDKQSHRFLDVPTRFGDLGTIDRFHVEAEIGRGGAGVVFRCFDPELRRQVAIKVLNNETGYRSVERFSRESRVAAKIQNDFVVDVHSVGSTIDGRPFIVMPIIKGLSLKQQFNQQLLPEKKTAEIIHQIATGLRAIHDAGIVHRDIKPANILLDKADDRAKLTDFGLAQDEVDAMTLTQANVLCGTPEYMSPEQSQGLKATNQSDIYSLGITLYECLTGTTPFRGQPLSVLKKHAETEPVAPCRLNPDISCDLETICLKAISKEPGKRYEAAHEFAADLDRWLSGKPIHARPVSILEKLGSWSRRNRLLSASLLLLVLTLVASSIATTLLSINSQKNARLAIARADSLESRTRELTQTTQELQDSNAELRSALDTFFERFLTDESFRMQLSTLFRNEMVFEMLKHYGHYLDQNPDSKTTIEVCTRVQRVTEHLLNLHFLQQASLAISWNLERLEPLVESDHSDLDALNLLTNVQLQASEFSDSYRDGKFKGSVDKAIQNSQQALTINAEDFSAQRNSLVAIAQKLYGQRKNKPDKASVGLQKIVSELDALAKTHPAEVGLFLDRVRYRRKVGILSTPIDRIRLRTESIAILQELKSHQEKKQQSSIDTQRSIAVNYTYRAKEYFEIDQLEEAENDFMRSTEMLRKLIATIPAFLVPRMDLAETLVLQGNLELAKNELDSALNFFQSAVVEFDQVSQMEEGQFPAIGRMSAVNALIARILFDNNRVDESSQYYHRAVDSYRKIFLQDSRFIGSAFYTEFERFLVKTADHFEQIGDKESAQRYRNEAQELRDGNPK